MENSRRSIAPSEDSVSMYLSFDADADDTLASKWQSVMTSQTSQYLEVQQSIDMGQHQQELDATLEEKIIKDHKKTVLKSFIQNESTTKDQSPLRPFDQSLLNKHNALSSTPTKNKTMTGRQDLSVIDANNKENTQPDAENTTLSSTIDGTASTVKINTLLTETNATLNLNEISAQESNNKTNNIYPLNADVLLENITEVSNEELSMAVASPVNALQDKKETEAVVVNMVNEVSQLINKALKLTDVEIKPKEQKKLPTIALPRPRRSFLPTSSGQTFKQRMSIVVKTTLNSPARKLATSNPSARRSCLPTAKSSLVGNFGYRRSTMVRSTESSCSISSQSTQASSAEKTSTVKFTPKLIAADIVKFNCQLCSASFRAKNQLDLHMRKHMDMKKPGVCKFCDKKFALERALHIHLMQNCDKIPPAEKRKLQYTELNHVKKAQLPKLVAGPPAVSGSSLKPRESTIPVAVAEPFQAATPSAVKMAPPSMIKVPKKVAHAGVYRTPTKTVPCHSCKQSFKSIIDYTTHCLTVHSKSQKHESANAPSAQD
ncbi:hypothetical protein ACLKA7_010804 [Drosophila subpalustris]